MVSNVLTRIVDDKKVWLEDFSENHPLSSFESDVQQSPICFYDALKSTQGMGFIFECKKASPSQGLIRPDFDLPSILSVYQHYATVVSILTDEPYFQGSFDYVRYASKHYSMPILCKDFFISPYQVYYARYCGANAILLMLSVLDEATYVELRDLAHSLGMGVLTEVVNETEMALALKLDAKVIGVNHRDLKDLSIDLNRSAELCGMIPKNKNVVVVGESGIYNYRDVESLWGHCRGVLVGTSLMKHDDLNMACRRLQYGLFKVCGLTRVEDVAICEAQGVTHGGLIFTERSPRYVSLERAQLLVEERILSFVGVFVNAPVSQIVEYSKALNLSVAQLHGDESIEFVQTLFEAFKAEGLPTLIWKSFSVVDKNPNVNPYLPYIEYCLLDGFSPGSGETFDWSVIESLDLSRCILAGGLSINNIEAALSLNFAGYDFNSRLESSPGIKEKQKVIDLFNYLHFWK